MRVGDPGDPSLPERAPFRQAPPLQPEPGPHLETDTFRRDTP